MDRPEGCRRPEGWSRCRTHASLVIELVSLRLGGCPMCAAPLKLGSDEWDHGHEAACPLNPISTTRDVAFAIEQEEKLDYET